MQIWNRNGRAILLQPSIGPSFAADFFICIARTYPLPDAIWQRKANHNPTLLSPVLGICIHGDTHVEAAMRPVLNIVDKTLVMRRQTEMTGNERFDIPTMLIDQREELVAFFDKGQLEEDVAFTLNNSGISRLAIEKPTFDRHHAIGSMPCINLTPIDK